MKRPVIPLLAVLLAAAALFSLTLGQYPVPVEDLVAYGGWLLFGSEGNFFTPEKAGLLEKILFEIRLPRILAAMLIGASLAVSGAAFQALFINPLVSPGLLGVLAGASFGAALAMVLTSSWVAVQFSTLLFGFTAVAVAAGIARVYLIQSIIMLVLGGIISGAFFTALLSLVKYMADPANQLPAIVHWLMGSLSSVDQVIVAVVGGPMLIGILALIFHARQLNVLSMGEEEAQSLGVDVSRVRVTVIFFATMISALTVMIAGMIGWVGLIIPHICRMLVGPNNEALLPAAALLGALYLLVIDDLSRLMFQFEIPIGIITSLIGIPFFALVLKNARRGWR